MPKDLAYWKEKVSKEQKGTQSPEFYRKSHDVVLIEKDFPVSTKAFSIALLQHRYKDLDVLAQRRAEKTIRALKTGKFYG
jgi:hypothetical protein|tara:strand:- start:6360 stop:6599 length:240 start_codon:yes stop_codon:yes gene_type:complete